MPRKILVENFGEKHNQSPCYFSTQLPSSIGKHENIGLKKAHLFSTCDLPFCMTA